MRDGPWKFVNKAKGGKAPALFQLGEDLGEARPVTNDPTGLT
jgi:hypothetical protein